VPPAPNEVPWCKLKPIWATWRFKLKAAMQAQYRLGVLFLLGDSVEQDLEAANRWLTRAAARQYPGALSLAEKLATWSQLESEREKKSIRILARAWMKSRSSAAFRFYRDAIRSIGLVLEKLLNPRTYIVDGNGKMAQLCKVAQPIQITPIGDGWVSSA
jgi:TPR repeat protein